MKTPAWFRNGAMAVAMPFVAAVAVWWAWPREPEQPTRKWAYDLNEHVLFPVPFDAQAPFPAPSGDLRNAPAGTPAGVEALVLRIAGTPEPVIAYLVKPDPAAGAGGLPLRLISQADPVAWHKEASPESAAIAAATRELSAGRSYDQDFPP